MMKNKKIAIVGGGLSGILFAYYLAKNGYEVTIFEKEKTLGGELATIKIDDHWKIEKFYHHLFLNNKETSRLFVELGLVNKLRWYKSMVAVSRNGIVWPFSSALDLLELPFLATSTKIRMGATSLLIPFIYSKKFEDITAKELVIKYMGFEAWEKFWEPMFSLKFASYSNKISASWFWGRLVDRLFTRKGTEILGYPDGGFSILLNTLVSRLKQLKVSIVTGHKIDKIKKASTGFKISNTYFDKVICALPMPVLNEIIPNLAKNTKHLSVITVLLETSDKITDYYWINILDKSMSFGVIVEHTNLVPSSNYGKHILYLSRYIEKSDSLYKQDDKEIAMTFINDLNKIYPLVNKKIVKSRVFRDDFAQPIIEKGYKRPSFYTSIPDLFNFSSAHIYPYDRGIDRVITEVKKNLNESGLLIDNR